MGIIIDPKLNPDFNGSVDDYGSVMRSILYITSPERYKNTVGNEDYINTPPLERIKDLLSLMEKCLNSGISQYMKCALFDTRQHEYPEIVEMCKKLTNAYNELTAIKIPNKGNK